MLEASGVATKDITSESTIDIVEPKNRYYNPLSRLFMLNRPRPNPRPPKPPRPPFNPGRNELDIIDLLLLYMLLRPHGRYSSSLCRIAHERIDVLSKLM